jgi:hypothetical protein
MLLLLAGVLTPRAARAELVAELVQIPISAEAIADEANLANAQTWQLRVTDNYDLMMLELYVKVAGGEIYQHQFGDATHSNPPHPALFQVWPALAFDSYVALPGIAGPFGPSSDDYRDIYMGPYGFEPSAAHLWINKTSRGEPPNGYTAAQLTLIPNQPTVDLQWIGRVYERTAEGAVERVFTSPGLASPFAADPNLDFKVDGADLTLWAAHFEQTDEPPAVFNPTYDVDIDDDGDTDNLDGGILLTNFGRTNATPGQGDVNDSGTVNSDDYKIFFHYNWGHKWNPADVDQDRDVDGADFLQWQRHVGGGFPEPPTQGAARVSEPVSLLLAAFTGLGLLARRGAPR